MTERKLLIARRYPDQINLTLWTSRIGTVNRSLNPFRARARIAGSGRVRAVRCPEKFFRCSETTEHNRTNCTRAADMT